LENFDLETKTEKFDSVVDENSNPSQGDITQGGTRPGFRRFKTFRPSPVRAGEEYEVKIESMSRRGDSGVAKIQGLVVFVTGTKVGDEVKVKITRVGLGYATGEVVNKTDSESEQTVSTE